MLEEKYKAKVEAMQIYVPLLTKLITKLEAKNDKSDENLEKISQLKILLQQLLDPKPGISFEELNECHQVMESLFKLNKTETINSNSQMDLAKGNERKSKKSTENNFNAQKLKISCTKTTISKTLDKVDNMHERENEEEMTTSTDEPENVEFIEFFEEAEGNDSFEEEEMILPYDEEPFLENKNEGKNNENNNSDENTEEMDDSEKDSDKEILEYINKTILSKKERSIKEIEIEELEDIEINTKQKEATEQFNENQINEQHFEEIEVNKSSQNEQSEISLKNIKILQQKIKSIKEKNSPKITETEPKQLLKFNKVAQSAQPIKIILSKPNPIKRLNIQNKNDSDTPELKKSKTFQTVITSSNKTLILMPEKGDDPLAVNTAILNTEKDIQQIVENKSESKNQEIVVDAAKDSSTDNNNKNDDTEDDDDIEIIENRSSPILIESDDNSNDSNKADEIMKLVSDEPKSQLQQRKIVISNVTSLSDKRVISKNSNIITTPQQQQKNIQIATQPHLMKLQEKSLSTIRIQTKSQHITINDLNKKQTKSKTAIPTAQSTRSNIKLQLKQVAGPNPQLFVTKVGNRKLVIPNAFYGNQKTTDNPDAAHCRWLENFLRHFCSPYNIAHNTCFLLLQRALRQEDFLRIQKERSNINVEKTGEIDYELLRSLRTIFYINGDPVEQKLTFVGRKFCNLAFVNILDKTISLTVDSRTNVVTSRTRISAATLEQQQKTAVLEIEEAHNLSDSNSNNTTMNTNSTEIPETATTSLTAKKQDAKLTNSTENKCHFRSVSQFIPVQQTSTPLSSPTSLTTLKQSTVNTTTAKQKKVGIDLKGIPATVIHIKKSVKNANKPEEIDFDDEDTRSADMNYENLENIIYNDRDNNGEDDDDDLELITSDPNNVSTNNILFQQQDNNSNSDQVDLSAAIREQDFILPIKNTTIVKNKEQEKPSKSFEMAFIERLAHQDNISRTQKALPADELIILEDELECEEEQKTKLPLEPYLLQKRRTIVKNINASINALSESSKICLICNRTVSHVVAHYVNKHPNYEVYVSRPTRKFANLLLNNTMELACHDQKRNDLDLFVSSCAFCEKVGSFTFCYWYQHFASHTGEYAFRCTGCGIRKPTRSHLLSHLGYCQEKGSLEQILNPDNTSTKIIAYMCRLCYYTQMYCTSILKHLKTEHGVNRVDKSKWASVTLLEIPRLHDHSKILEDNKKTNSLQNTKQNKSNKKATPPPPIIIRDSNGDIFEIAEIEDGKSVAVDLTSNNCPQVVNEAPVEDSKWYSYPNDEIGDVEGIIQAYINEKK